MIAAQNASDSGAARLGAFHRHPTEVVAGLVNDGSALPVAAAAVREAVRRRLPVRFLQLVTGVPGTGHDSSAEADEATVRAGLHALHGHPRTPSTFELVIGDPPPRSWLAAVAPSSSSSATTPATNGGCH
jgi:hypothetical protein